MVSRLTWQLNRGRGKFVKGEGLTSFCDLTNSLVLASEWLTNIIMCDLV